MNIRQHFFKYYDSQIGTSITLEDYVAKYPYTTDGELLPGTKKFVAPKYRTYKVKSGDVLGKVATRHGVSVAQLRSWNNLNSNLIRVGQVLIVQAEPVQKTISSATLALNEGSAASSKTYTVQPGDSLWIISKKHSLTIEQIKRLNNLNSTNIKPGQRLIVG